MEEASVAPTRGLQLNESVCPGSLILTVSNLFVSSVASLSERLSALNLNGSGSQNTLVRWRTRSSVESNSRDTAGEKTHSSTIHRYLSAAGQSTTRQSVRQGDTLH